MKLPEGIATVIDHTLLAPSATEADIKQFCKDAMQYNFATVCVNSCWVELCTKLLKKSDVQVCAAIGFPLGAMATKCKAKEAKIAIGAGATEVDMVINVGYLRGHDDDLVQEDITAVKKVCGKAAKLKVIIETALLTDEQKVRACRLAKASGADFVKTSTGFSGGGATVEDIALMRKTVGPEMGVKASGGIRSYSDAVAMLEAGATRIGASASIKIVEEEAAQQ